MKTINLPPLFFLTNPLRAVSNNLLTGNKPGQSPYLKAILSGKAGSARNSNHQPVANEDRVAAIRYIKESKRMKK